MREARNQAMFYILTSKDESIIQIVVIHRLLQSEQPPSSDQSLILVLIQAHTSLTHFLFLKKILLSAQSQSLSNVEMLLHRAPHALSALAQTAVWKCLEQIRCRISVWSRAAPQPRLSQRAWPAAAAEADMHRIYSTDNLSSPHKLPNSVRYLS